MRVRPAAVAGTFYPHDDGVLRRTLRELLDGADDSHPKALEGPPKNPKIIPKIIVAPHAGYVYSGPIAASVFADLRRRREISRVVLLGPAHRLYFKGICAPAADMFETPLGLVPIEKLEGIAENERAHASEHCLEVEVPFLQAALPGPFSLVPLLCGDVAPEEVADVISRAWGGPETLIVISSDLSHYLSYEEAQQTDAATARRVLALDPELDHDEACGATPLNAALIVAREHGLKPELVDLRNSGDTAGDRERVVGYASFVMG